MLSLEDAARRFFGLTDINKNTGFVLSNGDCLDLSGNHLKESDNKYRLMHFSFFGTNKNNFSFEDFFDYYSCFSKKYPMLHFMNDAQAIRYRWSDSLNNPVSIEYVRIPTKEQIEKIIKLSKNKPICISYTSLDCHLINDKYFEEYSLAEILNWFIKSSKMPPSNILCDSQHSMYMKMSINDTIVDNNNSNIYKIGKYL